MLMRRSRPVGSKQGLMSEAQSFPSPHGGSQTKSSASSLFPSPRLFRSFSSKGFSDHEATMSPTSILETKHFSSLGSLLTFDRQPRKHNNGGLEPTGLGILDALSDDRGEESSNPQRRMVLFGSQLRIQIPSPIEFGVKNKDSQLALLSPALRSLGREEPAAAAVSPRVFTGSISVTEMELSEDYTCVISHGPNPKTTHIFDNCIVESCGGNEFTAINNCKEDLGQGKSILIYRNNCDEDLDKLNSTGSGSSPSV